jgi:4-hydroxybenzoate polyprenyltransferase
MTQLAGVRELIVPKHFLFGLPWLGAAILFLHCSFSEFLIALVAFSALRLAGMVWNGIADRAFDAKNPRTSARPLARGSIDLRTGRLLLCALFALFFLSAALFGIAIFMLSLPVAGLVGAYSYTKRFSWGCHAVLGLIYLLVPPLTEFVFFGTISGSSLLLGVASGASISGNDILYSIQDMEFDRRAKLKSVPARFGAARSERAAAILQGVTILFLLAFGSLAHLSIIFFLAVASLGILYSVSWKRAITYEQAFRFFNMATGWIICAGILGDRIWRAMW